MSHASLARRWPAAALLAVLAACGGAGDASDAAPADRAGAVAATDSARPDSTPAAPVDVMANAPAQIRGIYINAYAAGSRTRREALYKLTADTEINAWVVDVKDERGLHYRGSQVALADSLTPASEKTIVNLKAFVDSLHARDIYAIARVVVFKDEPLSEARPEWSIRNESGGLWRDREGNSWVSAWDDRVWDYNIAIAEEAARAGFDMIQFDYVRFPEPFRSLPPQVHPKAQGERTDAIAAFLNRAKARLHPLGVPVTADVFGLTPNTADDLGIGQQWETISATADATKPMSYPSHYFPTHLRGVPRPNRMPYETVYQSVGMGVLRNQRLQEAGVRPARIIPWLQAFSAPWVERGFEYGPEQLRAQTRAVYDLGLDDWLLWHPGSKYEQVAAGLDRELRSHKKEYTPPEVVTNAVRQMEAEGVLQARQNAVDQARGRTTDPAAARALRTGDPQPSDSAAAQR